MLFTKEEYKQRLKKVQNSMQKKGIELLISQDTANMNYLPALHACREVEENKSNFIKAKISIQKMYREISFETHIIKK